MTKEHSGEKLSKPENAGVKEDDVTNSNSIL